MRGALASWRRWGVGFIWDAAEPEPERLRAVAEVITPQVSLTVIHVEAGAYLNVGGVFIDPRLAVPQQREAITTEVITEEKE